MKWEQLEGVRLGLDLDSPEYEGVQIDKYNFIKIIERYLDGVPSLDLFGSGFEIREGGIYLKLPPDRVWVSLTEAERAVLAAHPLGRPDKPVLAFPFTTRQLKVFLDWAESAGHDAPINEEALLEVIQAQIASRAPIPGQSDRPQQKSARHKTIPQQRLEVIQHWFDSQSEFTKDTLRTPESNRGRTWARQACWDWLSERGYTGPGGLFANGKARHSAKTRAFSDAWASFKS